MSMAGLCDSNCRQGGWIPQFLKGTCEAAGRSAGRIQCQSWLYGRDFVRARAAPAIPSRLFLLFLLPLVALTFLAPVPGGVAPAAAQSLEVRESEPGWRFEPLGPEGADVREILSLEQGCWIARTARGDLMLRTPSPRGFGRGAWERIPLAWEGTALRIAAGEAGERTAVILLSSGALLQWTCMDGWEPGVDRPHMRESVGTLGFSDVAGPDEKMVGEWGGPSDRGRGAFRLLGWVAAEDARSAVAIVPIPELDGGGVLLLMREGTCVRVHRDGTWEGWAPRFIEPGRERIFREPEPHKDCQLLLRGGFAHPSDPTLILALTEWEGLFTSRNGARSFVPAGGGLPKAVGALCPLAGTSICAASPEGIFVSHDNGASWILVGRPFYAGTGACGEIRQLMADPSVPLRLFAVTRQGHLLRSVDGGATWTVLLREIPARVRALACDPGRSRILLGTSRGVLCSADGGETWSWHNKGLRQVSVLSVATADDGGTLFLGTDLGFYASFDSGRVWLPTLPVSVSVGGGENAARFPRRGGELAGGSLLTGLTKYPAMCGSEAAWRRLSACVSAVAMSESPSGLRLLCAGTEEGLVLCRYSQDPREGLLRAPEGGLAWWDAPDPGRATTAVLAQPNGSVWVSGGQGRGLWAGSVDSSGRWTEWLAPELSGESPFSWGVVPALARLPGSGTEGALLAAGALTALAGEAPLRIPVPAGREALSVASFGADLWLGTDAGLYRSASGGAWSLVAFERERVGEVLSASGRGDALLCHTADGILWTSDGGRSWSDVPAPSGLQVISLGLDPGGRRIFLGTRYGLCLARPPEPVVLVSRPLPIEAFPNPFSRQVLLRCRLVPSGRVGSEEADLDGAGLDQAPGDASGFEDLDFPDEAVSTWKSGTAAVDAREPDELEAGTPAADILGSGQPQGQDGGTCVERLALEGLELQGIEIRIISVHGQLVRRVMWPEALYGDGGERFLQWTWEGRNEQGQEAPNGIYLVSTRVGNQSYVGKIVKFR